MIDDKTLPRITNVNNLFRLDRRVALVTGGGNGIGRTAAHILAQAGAYVVVTDLDVAAAYGVATEIKSMNLKAEAQALDVTQESAVTACVAGIGTRLSRLDVLVNSAGAAKRLPTVETPLEVWNHIVAVNLTGVFLCCREAGKLMLAQQSGSIINLSSIMGHTGGGLYPNPAYHATKGAVVNLTRALAAEWGSHGVRVNDIAPTFVNTRFAAPVTQDPKLRPLIESLTPLGRIAEVQDLAGAILFLASPASAMVTGHSLAVDGGWLAR